MDQINSYRVAIESVETNMVTQRIWGVWKKKKKKNLHFMSFPHIDMTQVVEIITQVRQGPTHFT